MTLAELLATRNQGTSRFPGFSLTDLLARRNEPLDAKFNPSGVGPGVSYGSLASILTDFAPGIGDAKSAVDAVKEAEAGNYGMSLLDAFGALPMVGGMGAIKAFHGSPHKFDAFDMSKIGTGEGAQAYGHGLYFAESPGIAKWYADKLGGDDGWDTAAQKIFDSDSWFGDASKYNESDINDALRKAGVTIEHLGSEATEDDLLSFGAKLLDIGPDGRNLYETSLEWPDPAREAADPLGPQHFLDWDKPLSEQPESVSDALKNIGDTPQDIRAAMQLWEQRTTLPGRRGESAKRELDALSRKLMVADARQWDDIARRFDTKEQAAQQLKDAGIPGIRYLDQGSRGAGDGTYNYVVFDDKIPRIVSRNGVSLRDLYDR